MTRAWTPEEDLALRLCLEAGRDPVWAARWIGREIVETCARMALARDEYARNSHAWDSEADRYLATLARSGLSLRAIAQSVGRSYSATAQRLSLLRAQGVRLPARCGRLRMSRSHTQHNRRAS